MGILDFIAVSHQPSAFRQPPEIAGTQTLIARLVIQVKPSIRDSIELDFHHLGETNYDRF
ncbi:MAG: hypothetical protein DWQ53_11030 [Microcystis flos-aquae DF17]|nr:MAG: hypothetical protein DWQ53_11030 [Microcystis flos-aquae DF17]